MNLEKKYKNKVRTAEESLDLIKSKDIIFTAQAAGAPMSILNELHLLKERDVEDTVLLTCLPLEYFPAMDDPELKGILTHESWFFSPWQRKTHKDKFVSAIPQHSTSALWKKVDRAKYEGRRLVVLATCSPLDEHGYVSLSVSSIYERDLIDEGALVILEINPNYPRTFGNGLVHIDEVDAFVECNRPVPEIQLTPYTEKDERIGKYVADLVEDGSTIQLGIGNIPNAIAAELKSKKNLGIHTEMFTETMIDLIESGAVTNTEKGYFDGYSICSFAFGSRRLYDYLDNNPSVLFQPATLSNDPFEIAKTKKFVSINATLEIDLTGQCASESIGHKQFTGTGGQADTIQGAQRSEGGKSIIAMHSTYTTTDEKGETKLHSKIVPSLTEGAIVSTQRNDTDYVVTEYGVAWLRGASVKTRVEELIKIAHPEFRDWLREEAIKKEIW